MLSNQSSKIDSLEALRGISAFLVVGYHWAYMLNGVFPSIPDLGWKLFYRGFIGVDIFFVISGVVMVVSTAKDTSQSSVGFIIRRLFRLMPLLWVVFTLTQISRGAALDIIQSNSYWEALFFILPGGEAPQYGQGLVDVAWTLTYEVIFYAIFALALCVLPQHRVWVASIIIVLMVFSLQWLYGGFVTLDTDAAPQYVGSLKPQSILSLLANPYFFEFIAGMLLGSIYLKMETRNTWWASALGVIAILFFVYAYMSFPITTKNKLFSCLPWAFILVVGALIWEKWGYCKVPQVFVFLGSLTYALYLSHIPLYDVLQKSSWAAPISSLTGVAKFTAYCGLAIFLATILHFCVEKPFMRLGQRLAKHFAQ